MMIQNDTSWVPFGQQFLNGDISGIIEIGYLRLDKTEMKPGYSSVHILYL